MLAALAGTELQAQTLQSAPRLVVNIAIDQLRTDYIEHFSPLYGEEGFRKLLQNGCVYEAANYPFSPVDRASAIATIATGATPHYNNIVGTKWLDRNTLRPVFCTDDETYNVSPQKIATTTVSDELKIFTKGAALVYSTAMEKDAARQYGGAIAALQHIIICGACREITQAHAHTAVRSFKRLRTFAHTLVYSIAEPQLRHLRTIVRLAPS